MREGDSFASGKKIAALRPLVFSLRGGRKKVAPRVGEHKSLYFSDVDNSKVQILVTQSLRVARNVSSVGEHVE
ncbi:hypothetical protein SPHV1_100039 [Novosphingobium sp. KN65.2]|nr:hypothetical protein SPHV1_100039 [Novosphingobium sp. KN65.2]